MSSPCFKSGEVLIEWGFDNPFLPLQLSGTRKIDHVKMLSYAQPIIDLDIVVCPGGFPFLLCCLCQADISVCWPCRKLKWNPDSFFFSQISIILMPLVQVLTIWGMCLPTTWVSVTRTLLLFLVDIPWLVAFCSFLSLSKPPLLIHSTPVFLASVNLIFGWVILQGRCHKERSGFEGAWTTNPLIFDNSYFTWDLPISIIVLFLLIGSLLAFCYNSVLVAYK